MDDTTFSTRVQQVLEAFNDERDDFDSLMDAMTVDCTEDQWQDLLHTLESERRRLETLAKDAKDRVAKLPTFRTGREERTVPGTVWVVTLVTDYATTDIVDVCETRTGAAGAAESDALYRVRQERPGAKKAPWRAAWKKADAHCPCPMPACDHEQWTRPVRGGAAYIIQSWSTSDGKHGRDDDHDDVRPLRDADIAERSEAGHHRRGAVL